MATLSSSPDLFLEEKCEPVLCVEDDFGQLTAVLVPPTPETKDLGHVSCLVFPAG